MKDGWRGRAVKRERGGKWHGEVVAGRAGPTERWMRWGRRGEEVVQWSDHRSPRAFLQSATTLWVWSRGGGATETSSRGRRARRRGADWITESHSAPPTAEKLLDLLKMLEMWWLAAVGLGNIDHKTANCLIHSAEWSCTVFIGSCFRTLRWYLFDTTAAAQVCSLLNTKGDEKNSTSPEHLILTAPFQISQSYLWRPKGFDIKWLWHNVLVYKVTRLLVFVVSAQLHYEYCPGINPLKKNSCSLSQKS